MSEETLCTCRHEYVKIFQRRLKGLERRLVSTRGFLPTGFKVPDFLHLGEGSYCFCTNCRVRLFPRKTQAEKLAARLALAQSKLNIGENNERDVVKDIDELVGDFNSVDIGANGVDSLNEVKPVHVVEVEELDFEVTEMDELEADRVKLSGEEDSLAGDGEDI